jgi:MFS superfamily sulfate permease-like transporter
MYCRELKRRLQPRYPGVAYIPDRFVVVVLSAIFAWKFEWDKQGLAILGNVQTSGRIFSVHFPFETSHLKYASDAINTALIIALLGFFESSVAAKSLGSGDSSKDGVQMQLSANRELIALGTANMVGGLFMALPAFGGYGRSKVNASTGGTTPMSSILLSIITILCTCFMLPYFYYLPKGVLCAMVSVVAYSLVEEAPHDIKFFWRIRGWSELSLMFGIFLATIFWDLKRGIAVGIGLSILRLIRHSTRPRIQILGRVPGTTDKFANAELDPGNVEFIEGCLIVKIPEPLTFANTGDLKNRLNRLEAHGTGSAHPALPRVRRPEHNKNIIFDVHGVTSIDGAGTQVLSEIIQTYRNREVRVFFCRVPSERSDTWRLFEASGIVEMCGGRRHFVSSVEAALRMTELESMTEEFGMDPDNIPASVT